MDDVRVPVIIQDAVQLPRWDRIFLLLMNAGLPDHSDAYNVFFMDSQVGAMDGDGDASLQWAKKRDDLDGEIQCGGGEGVQWKRGFEMDLNRLVVQ